MIKLLDCPICGKQPKVIFDCKSNFANARCTIKCKPFMRRKHFCINVHISTKEYMSYKNRCLEAATFIWNNNVNDYIKHKKISDIYNYMIGGTE